MLNTNLINITNNKKGVEIGGPSQYTGGIIYNNALQLDNVVFSYDTIWKQHTYEYKFNYNREAGKTFFNDATNIIGIDDNTYDFCFASHTLEHIANPLKAIKEWIRIVKKEGYIIIIVPEKSVCFDHKREYSKFNTLLEQYKKNVGEDDLSTLPEILQNHDLNLDKAAGNFEEFTKRSLNNYNNRCLHHYVYNDDLLMEICNYFNCKFIYKETNDINRWFIIQK